MKRTHAAWLLAGLALTAGTANAADMPERELSLLLGGGYVDGDMTGEGADRVHPILGVRYGQRLGTATNLFGDLTYTSVDGARSGVGDGNLMNLRGGLEWLFSQQDRYNWFLAGGLGLMNMQSDGPDFTRPLVSLGIGQAWEIGVNDALRWEVRADQSFGNGDLPDRTGNSGLSNVQALVGYSWGLGAPLDSDGDGVPNRMDQCPNTPTGAKVDTKGCPLDSDGDGVFDGLDQCPATPAGVKVTGNGCPVDTDGDGIADYKDKCPTVPAPGTPEGCPLDTDGDGVLDAKDACPTVAAPGTADGCPPKAAEPAAPKKLTLDGVNFDNDSAKLRPESTAVLDNAAATLKEWGEVRVEVAGHTDSTSSDEYNVDLSQRRADAVRAYLIDKGVAADRLTAKGYGEANPVADNATEEGRFKNRRVELVPQQ
jgi:OOP family OmpA-OmpF porin